MNEDEFPMLGLTLFVKEPPKKKKKPAVIPLDNFVPSDAPDKTSRSPT
jgi:hypothetical protein